MPKKQKYVKIKGDRKIGEKRNRSKGYLQAYNDYVFKEIFNNPEYLKRFYQVMFNIEVRNVEVSYMTLIKGKTYFSKKSELDCISNIDNITVHLEMQNKINQKILKRIEFYCGKLASSVVGKGCRYEEMGKIISIWIFREELNKKDNIYMDKINKMYRLRQKEVGEELVEIYIIELTKILRDQFKTYDINNEFLQWLYFIGSEEEDEIMQTIRKLNPCIDEIIREICEYEKNDKMGLAKLREELSEMTYLSDLAQEREQGVRQGVKQGAREGAEEEKNKMIYSMYELGGDISFIAKVANISEKKVIEILRKKNLSK